MKATYKIDPVHSGIHFSVRHLMISTVRGSFSGLKGTAVYDADNPSASSVEAEIDINTITTNDEKRDGHLKTPDFFDAAAYPTMTYVSTGVTKDSGSAYKVAGNLTLHGITKPVTLDVEEVSPETKDGWGSTRIGVTAKAKINRKDFGLVWNAPVETGGVVIGEDVKIEFDIQLIKS